jgi:hypothetical protein
MSATRDNVYVCITERETTTHGYWWRYQHADDEPQDTLLAAIMIAGDVAATEARKRGKTYYVARAASGPDAIYIFACDHPDARNAAINVMFEFTPRRRAHPPSRHPPDHPTLSLQIFGISRLPAGLRIDTADVDRHPMPAAP